MENNKGHNRKAENSWRCVFVLLLLTFTGTFITSYGLAGLNPITPEINSTFSEIYQNRYDSPMPRDTWTLLISLTMSMVFIGGLVGALATNLLLGFLSRRWSIAVLFIIFSIGNIMLSLGFKAASSYEVVICGRFIIGVALGLGMSIFPLVINELCVPSKRMTYGALYGAVLPFAGMSATFIGWSEILGAEENYIGSIIFAFLYPVVFFLGFHWLPDTPVEIVMKHGSERALASLRSLRAGYQGTLEIEVQEMVAAATSGNDEPQEPLKEATFKEIMTTAQYRKHFITVIFLYSLLMACGFSNVLSFSNQILVDAGLESEAVTPANIGTFFIGFVASLAAIAAMKKFDPRTILIFSYVVVVLSHALMTASQMTYKEIPAMSWVAVAALWIFMAFFSVANTATFGVMGVLCIDRTRSKSMLAGSAGFWFFGWFVGFLSPYLSNWIQGYAFLVWMGVTILGIAYTLFFMPVTRGKTENEVQSFYRK